MDVPRAVCTDGHHRKSIDLTPVLGGLIFYVVEKCQREISGQVVVHFL